MNIFNQGIIGLINPNIHGDFCSNLPPSESTSSSFPIEDFMIPFGIMIIIGGIATILFFWNIKRISRKKREYYRDMGDSFLKEGDLVKARSFLEYYVEVSKMKNYKFSDGTDHRIIAQIYLSYNKKVMAINYFSEALKLDQEAGYQDGMIIDLGNLFLLHLWEGDYEKAFDYDMEYLNVVGTTISGF